jgi:hypothetical protein
MGCHSPLGLGLGEAQHLLLLPPLAAGPRGVLPPYILYPLLSNTIITFFPNSHLLSWYHEIELDLDSSRFRPTEQRLCAPALPNSGTAHRPLAHLPRSKCVPASCAMTRPPPHRHQGRRPGSGCRCRCTALRRPAAGAHRTPGQGGQRCCHGTAGGLRCSPRSPRPD